MRIPEIPRREFAGKRWAISGVGYARWFCNPLKDWSFPADCR
jgi:hypothetical protein